jgi:hypothetical protein
MPALMSIQEVVAVKSIREIVPPPAINANLFMEQETPAKLMKLTAGDFQKWLRKIIRKHGRKFEIGDQCNSPIEIWLKELGYNINFLCTGEMEWQRDSVGSCINLFSGWTSLCIEIYREEDGMLRTKAGEMLDVAMWEKSEEFLIAR